MKTTKKITFKICEFERGCGGDVLKSFGNEADARSYFEQLKKDYEDDPCKFEKKQEILHELDDSSKSWFYNYITSVELIRVVSTFEDGCEFWDEQEVICYFLNLNDDVKHKFHSTLKIRKALEYKGYFED